MELARTRLVIWGKVFGPHPDAHSLLAPGIELGLATWTASTLPLFYFSSPGPFEGSVFSHFPVDSSAFPPALPPRMPRDRRGVPLAGD